MGLQSASCCLGALGVLWAVSVLPTFWHAAEIQHTESRIRGGEKFNPARLSDLAPSGVFPSQTMSFADLLRADANIRIAKLDHAFDVSGGASLDPLMSDARRSAISSLLVGPADAFTWLALYWLTNTESGFKRDNLKFLRLSYSMGPNEAWVAVPRNRFALAVFAELDDDLQERVVGEFVKLVDAGLITESVAALVNSGWAIRDRLLPRLEGVSLEKRERFAKVLADEGFRVTVPGVSIAPIRPWK